MTLNRYKQVFRKRGDKQWLIDYLQEHPDKIFKKTFPDIFNIAMATKEYKRINLLRKSGLINEKEYENQLEKILPLVDISSIDVLINHASI